MHGKMRWEQSWGNTKYEETHMKYYVFIMETYLDLLKEARHRKSSQWILHVFGGVTNGKNTEIFSKSRNMEKMESINK